MFLPYFRYILHVIMLTKEKNWLVLDIPFEVSKVINYIAKGFVKQWLSYLTIDDFEKISQDLNIDINLIKQIYWNVKYRKAIENYIIALKKEKQKEKNNQVKMIDNKEVFVQDDFFIDIENSNQIHLKTWNIEIHLSEKLFSIYDVLNEERLFLIWYQRKWKWTQFAKFIEDRITEIKKIRKKINHVLWNVIIWNY